MKDVPYASAVGSIMYAMLCTRPDVALAINMAGRFQSNAGKEHWMTVKGILKYLKRTKDMSLVYGGMEEELAVMGYVDASFDSDLDDQVSIWICVYVELWRCELEKRETIFDSSIYNGVGVYGCC